MYTKNNTQITPKLTFFNTEEGYVEPVFEMTGGEPLGGGLQGTTPIVETLTGFEYTYQYKDHLGNIRLSYQDLDGNGTIDPITEIKEENHYYPFGLKHKGYNNQITGRDHQYGYGYEGQKEEQNELGLNWIDFGARNYDASLGRWMNIDPLADKYVSLSPFGFVANSPILLFDPDGRWIPGIDENGKLQLTAEKGDDLNSLYSYFGGKQNAKKYLHSAYSNEKIASKLSIGEGTKAIFNKSNTYSKGISWFVNTWENSNDVNDGWCNTTCHGVALLGSRDQSLIDLGGKDNYLNNISPLARNNILKEQYDEVSRDDNGAFNFEEKGVVGETIITIGDKHSAVYFGTDKNGNAYFLSKHNKGGYTIDTYDQIIEKYKGKESDVNAYSIKKEYKNKKLTNEKVEKSQ